MPLFINTNVASLNAQRQLVSSGAELDRASERLSSGKRINKAADDAAGLAISNRLTSQIRGLDQAVRNANDGISLIQTAEGALSESTNILQRMRELAIQSANGIFDDAGRATLDAEVQQLVEELDRIAETTSFNGQTLLDGTQGEVKLQVGAEANQTIGFEVQAVDSKTLGLGSLSADVLGAELDQAISTTALDQDDVLINGQQLGALTTGSNMEDLIDNINTNVNGVEASSVVELTASTVGTGILEGTSSVTIAVNDNAGNVQSFVITDTTSLDDFVDKVNATTGGVVSATIGSDGKLSISAQDAQDITLTDAGGVTGGASTTQRAQIILTSESGDPITVERGATGDLLDLAHLGFRESKTAGVIEGVGLVATGAAGANAALGVGELSINGVEIDNTDTDSLVGKIDAINDVSDQTGVVANAFSELTIDMTGITLGSAGAFASSSAQDQLSLNGVVIDLQASSGGLRTLADIANAFNDNTDLTGVSARVNGQNIVLSSDQGAITLAGATAAAVSAIQSGAAAGFVGATFRETFATTAGVLVTSSTSLTSGAASAFATTKVDANAGLKLTSTNGNPISIELGDQTAGTTDLARLGLVEANTLGEGSFGTALASISVDTQANAQKAIDVIDTALDTINSIRSDLGAVNNRLDFTISNLSNVSENSSAARSRILDADFAAETAALSRSQVLQQASSAILAQANARPQQVLSLLQ
ncbi:MAG: flagellin [Exilibacterium sp.]